MPPAAAAATAGLGLPVATAQTATTTGTPAITINPNYLAPPSPTPPLGIHTATSSAASSASSSPSGMPSRSIVSSTSGSNGGDDSSDETSTSTGGSSTAVDAKAPSSAPSTLTISTSTSEASTPAASVSPHPQSLAPAAYAAAALQAAALQSPHAYAHLLQPHAAATQASVAAAAAAAQNQQAMAAAAMAAAAAYYPAQAAAAATMYPTALAASSMMAAMAGGAIGPSGEEISAASPASASYLADAHDEAPSAILLVSIFDPRVAITTEFIYLVFSPYGELLKVVTFMKGTVMKVLVQFRFVQSAEAARLALDGKEMFVGCCLMRIQYSTLLDLVVKQNGPRARDFTTANPAAAAAALYGMPATAPSNVAAAPASGPTGRGCVLLVSNLAEQSTPDVLFTIFGVYGDVQRVKIFYNKRDTALIQFSDPHQAYLAHLHLNHVEVFGKAMSITPSKHAQVALRHPTPDQPPQTGMLLTRDYSNSPLHRFKNVRSNNYRHICPPGPVLHLSNLHNRAGAEELTKLMGDQCVAVQFFKTDRRMAFARFTSTSAAVAALLATHNMLLQGRHLRVSFSHKNPEAINDDMKFDDDEDSPPSTDEPEASPRAPPSFDQVANWPTPAAAASAAIAPVVTVTPPPGLAGAAPVPVTVIGGTSSGSPTVPVIPARAGASTVAASPTATNGVRRGLQVGVAGATAPMSPSATTTGAGVSPTATAAGNGSGVTSIRPRSMPASRR